MANVAALEAELAAYEARLGQLQSEISQSNAIMQRVKMKIDQKEQELGTTVLQFEQTTDTLAKAEKLTSTSHQLVNQALKNNGVVPAPVLAKLHLLDAAHNQIVEGMKKFPPKVLNERTSTPQQQRMVTQPQLQQNQQTAVPMTAPASGVLRQQSSQSLLLNNNTPGMPRLVRQNPSPAPIRSETPDDNPQQPTGGTEDNYQYFGLSSF